MSKEPIQIELSLGVMFQTVNCYLVPGDQLTLIDCGLDTDENWKTFQGKLEEHRYKVSDIEQVVLTHEHRDHIGLLPKILEHSQAVIRTPKSIKGWFTHPQEMHRTHHRFTERLFKSLGFPEDTLAASLNYFEMVQLGMDVHDMDRFEFFEAGDSLNLEDTIWKILNTPGHCPTQYVFIQEEQQRIFSGDMLLPIAPMPIIYENKEGQPTRSLNELLASFERLKLFDFKTIYPGHGPVFNNANEIIEKQLARIEMRKSECFEAIKDGLDTPYKINRKMYPYQMMPPDFSGMFMVLGYIDLLEAEEKILREFDENGNLILRLR